MCAGKCVGEWVVISIHNQVEKSGSSHQVELRYAVVFYNLCARVNERKGRREKEWNQVLRHFSMRRGRMKEIFHSTRERQREKWVCTGKRNSDHVLRQSISAAANGCSEKGDLKGQQLVFLPQGGSFHQGLMENWARDILFKIEFLFRIKSGAYSLWFKRVFNPFPFLPNVVFMGERVKSFFLTIVPFSLQVRCVCTHVKCSVK